MRYVVCVYGAPESSMAPFSALAFVKALIKKKHTIAMLFFYGDAVHIGVSSVQHPRDEVCIHTKWKEFAQKNQIILHLCSGASARAGIVIDQPDNLNYPFQLSGLGEFVESVVNSDRFITFGR